MGRRDGVWIVAVKWLGETDGGFHLPRVAFSTKAAAEEGAFRQNKQYIQEYQNAPYEIEIDWGADEWSRDYSRALAILTYEREGVQWKALERLQSLAAEVKSLPSKGRPLLDEDAKFLLKNWGDFRIAEAVHLPVIGTS